MDYKISEYLTAFNKETQRGVCKSCQRSVYWSKHALAAHKRASCEAVSQEEQRRFSKRKQNPNQSEGDENQSTSTKCSKCELDEDQINDAHSKLADFFFRSGISLRLADSVALKDFVKTVNPTYAEKMPSSRTLSGPLLDQQYTKCSQLLQDILDDSNDLTLISDGWTNVRGDHIVNFCIKAPNRKPFFHSSINTAGISQNAHAVADAIILVIEQLGSGKFSCVVTDNAAVMKAAWKIIEAKFPHITAMGCAAHGLNLLIKDILDTSEYAKTMKEAEKIIKFVMNHHIVKAKYETLRKQANVPQTLTMAVVTRWFSRYTSMNNLSTSKYVLIQLVGEASGILKEIAPKQNSAVVLNIIKTNEFWDDLLNLVKVIEYPANIIGLFFLRIFFLF